MKNGEKLMESKKFNWNRLLSCLIAGVGFVLLCLFIGICFVTPIASVSVKALTKQDIEDANISEAKLLIATPETYITLETILEEEVNK